MSALDAPAHEVPARTPAVIRWLVLATFIVILNETIMINAIPRLMADLDISARSAQWLSTAFMLTMAAVIPTTGWFLQRVTTRTAYATAMGVFAAGTLLARNDDFGAETGRDARVDLTVAAGVEVTVEVSGFGSTAGPYLVTVEPVG